MVAGVAGKGLRGPDGVMAGLGGRVDREGGGLASVGNRGGESTFVGQIFPSSGGTDCWSNKFPAGQSFLHLCISNEQNPNPIKSDESESC